MKTETEEAALAVPQTLPLASPMRLGRGGGRTACIVPLLLIGWRIRSLPARFAGETN